MIEALNAVLLLLILIAAVAAVMVPELISAAFLIGTFSFFCAILWAMLGAVDVSFTEAVVGAGVSTIFIFLALAQTRHTMKKPAFAFKPWLALVLCTGAAALFLMMSLDLPSLGDVQSPASQYLSGYYLENTLKDTRTPNAVTSIIVDYRAFDTLIETVVIFAAAISCLVIMRMKHD